MPTDKETLKRLAVGSSPVVKAAALTLLDTNGTLYQKITDMLEGEKEQTKGESKNEENQGNREAICK